MKKNLKKLAVAAVVATSIPSYSFACACGHSLMDIGTSSLIPSSQGGLLFAEYNSILQNKNLHKTKSADASDNHLQKIDTQIVTVGGQYMFNRKWGVMARVPYVTRSVTMQHHDEDMMDEAMTTKTKHGALGDVKLSAIYSGLFDDMSTGFTFGIKLPTGATKQSGFDSDTQIGSGSTDVILGAYHLGKFTQNLGWFSQINWQEPIITKRDYTPGSEFSGAIGSYYNFGNVGIFSKVSPILQIIASKKTRDSGANADAQNSGYSRAFFAPAIEVNFTKFKIYADYEMPIHENVNGYQLSVGKVIKVILGYKF